MKSKRQIGFRILKDDQEEDLSKTAKNTDPQPNQLIENFINGIYHKEPAEYSTLEHISPIDLFELLNQNFEISKEQIYTIMNNMGFKCKHIDGSLYWQVYTTQDLAFYK